MKDDRGKPVRYRSTDGDRARAIFRRRPVFASAMLAIYVTCFAVLAWITLSGILTMLSDWRWVVGGALVLSPMIGVCILGWFTWDRRYIAIPRVKTGQCGACEHDLRSLPPESDGCTVCPECGAAWRLPSSDEG